MQKSEIANNPCLKPEGDIVSDKVHDLRESLATLLAENPHEIILDCSSMDNIYSNGLSLLIRFHKKLGEAGGKGLVLINVSPQLHKLLTTVNLHKILPCFSTEEEYLLQSGSWETEDSAPEEERPQFSFQVIIVGQIMEVKVEGMMSLLCNLNEFRNEVLENIEAVKGIVIGLEKIYILDSTGINILLEINKACQNQKKKLVLWGAQKFIEEIHGE